MEGVVRVMSGAPMKMRGEDGLPTIDKSKGIAKRL